MTEEGFGGHRVVLGLVLCLAANLAAGCSSKGKTTPPAPAAVKAAPAVESAAAKSFVDKTRRLFTFDRAWLPLSAPSNARSTIKAIPELPAGGAKFGQTDQMFVPRLPHAQGMHLRMQLPRTARDPFKLTETDTGVSLEVALSRASGDGEVGDGYAVYRGALGSSNKSDDGTLLMRPFHDGIEDYVVFRRAPVAPEVDYDVALGDKVAGIRVVDDVVEFLDAGGAPRLRMASPHIVGADGVEHLATSRVSGCAVDTSPVAPFGRPVTDPGARRCTVHVSWSAKGLRYPALLDPQWTTTRNLIQARAEFTATPFKCGTDTCLLIAGGRGVNGAVLQTNTAEIYDLTNPPSSAATGQMNIGRMAHTATYIDVSGLSTSVPALRILVAGGTTQTGGNGLKETEYYDPVAGTWTSAGSMAKAREGQTATGIPDTTHTHQNIGVLVIGGRDTPTDTPYQSMEFYRPDGSGHMIWASSTSNGHSLPTLQTPRVNHAATVLTTSSNNQPTILVAGGISSSTNSYTNTAEELEFQLDTDNKTNDLVGKSAASMGTARAYFGLVGVADNEVVAIGGVTPSGYSNTGELFNGSWTPVNGTLSVARIWFGLQLMANTSRVLIAGGITSTDVQNTDIYDLGTNSFYPASPLNNARGYLASPDIERYLAENTGSSPSDFYLSSGYAMGGLQVTTPINSVEKWLPAKQGDTCTESGDCGKLHCVDGYCCDSACTGDCNSCALGGTHGTCSPMPAGSAGSPTTCSPFVCDGVDSGCPTKCTSDNNCASGYYCDQSQKCSPVKTQGTICNESADCYKVNCRECTNGVGTCVDNVCCDSTCTGACATCQNSSGVCTVVPEKTPGNPPCNNDLVCNGKSADCPTSCSTKADCVPGDYCDAGTCKLETNGTPCTTGSDCPATLYCADGVCCNSSCTGGCSNCDLSGTSGTCSPVSPGTKPVNCSTSSTGYLCNGSELGCPTSCLKDADCAPDHYCAADSTCKPTKTNGATCGASDCLVSGCRVCGSKYACVDGVCCDSACSGACDACNLPNKVGTCSPMGAGQPGSPSCAPYLCGSGSACATTCSSNNNCAAGAYCDSTGHCVAQAGVGTACSSQSQCGSGLTCVDGVCCTTDCTGTCKACSAAKKGSGVDGYCGPIKAGTDPDSECANTAASGCGTTGMCDGAGKCSLWPAGTTCGTSTSCTAGVETQYQCNGQGVCQPAGTTYCAPYVCSGNACGAQCTSDVNCSSTTYCDTSTSKCVARNAPGTACTAVDQCASGFCVDGVCCDKACTGTCYACTKAKKGTGDDGVCGPIAAGTDPDNECAQDPVSTCQHNGYCNGAGTCAFYAIGTACGSVSCVGNSAVGKVCNSFNECKAEATGVDCAPYVCGATGCPGSCTDSTQCTTGYYCSGGLCVAQKTQGETCSTADECAKGNCVDGYCCDQACTAQCQACDVAGAQGTCTTFSGDPTAHNKNACNGTGACAGTCDGNNTTCVYPDSTTTCEGSACVGNVYQPKVCDGQGTCVAGQSQDCGNYACDSTAGACKTKCQSDSDCASGSSCNTTTGQCAALTATCKDAYTVIQANGQEESCEPYKCVAGVCQQQCSTSNDCAPGYKCQGSQCLPVPDAGSDSGSDSGTDSGTDSGSDSGNSATDSGSDSGTGSGAHSTSNRTGGCGCGVPGGSERAPLFALSGLLLIAFDRRRRRSSARRRSGAEL